MVLNGDYMPPLLRNARMFACVADPRLDSQLQNAPTKQTRRQSDQSCLTSTIVAAGVLINSNWIELVEDRVCASTHAHTHTQRQAHTSYQHVFVFLFSLLVLKFWDYGSHYQQTEPIHHPAEQKDGLQTFLINCFLFLFLN